MDALETIQKKALLLIQQERFEAVPPLLKKAAEVANDSEKKGLIPLAEEIAEAISNAPLPQRLEACDCWLIAADLSAQVHGESNDHAIEKLRIAWHAYSCPTCTLTDEQAKGSAAKAVELIDRYVAILRRHYPKRENEIAHALGVKAFTAFWGDPVDESEFKRLDAFHKEAFKAISESFGERSDEFASELKVYGTFLSRNGRVAEGRNFLERGERLEAALEGGLA